MPTISAIENGAIDSPPRTSNATSTSNVVIPVINVRASISLIEIFIADSSADLPRRAKKFSRMRSKATTVSLSE